MIESITTQGVFIHFKFNQKTLLPEILKQSIEMKKLYGNNSSGMGKFACCEYSSPNIAKPFHLGHLRSTIIGSFVKKVLENSGWKTVSINYLGDWGKQYGLLAVGFEKYGDEEKLVQDPIGHLFEIYVKINKDAAEDEKIHDVARQYFKKMEDGILINRR